MDKTNQFILNELRSKLKEIYGDELVSLLLFGSQARGDAVPGSDFDILVVLQHPVQPGLEIKRTGVVASGLSLKYDIVLSLVFTSSQRFPNEQSPFFLNIRREGIAV